MRPCEVFYGITHPFLRWYGGLFRDLGPKPQVTRVYLVLAFDHFGNGYREMGLMIWEYILPFSVVVSLVTVLLWGERYQPI